MRSLSFLALLLWSLHSVAQIEMRSPDQRVSLLELYTSEGCSSCPPADRWLSSLVDHRGLWTEFVPVALHVDYWDDLGWQDRFAHPEYAMRQRLYKMRGLSRAVYTPGVMLGGKEWGGWRHGTIPRDEDTAGILQVTIKETTFMASFDRPPTTDNRLTIALLGFGLKTPVKGGENRGRLLLHNFVVLSWTNYMPEQQSTDTKRQTHWMGDLPTAPADAREAQRLAWVAWVNGEDKLTPLQAVGGWTRSSMP